jgi:hypothetical protein
MRMQSEGLTQARMVDETGSSLQGKARQKQTLILPKDAISAPQLVTTHVHGLVCFC